ncbi:MAG: hypothetical protein AB1644_05565, partial [Candidatus Zixiibacteriota bacterium]
MRVRTLTAVCVVLCGLVSLLLLACSDGPTKPKPPEKEYPFYFRSNAFTYYRFHPVSKQIDTIVLPYRSFPNI